MPFCDIDCIWTYIPVGGYEDKDMVSELHYNLKLCPALKCKKRLFNYTSVFKGRGHVMYKKSL